MSDVKRYVLGEHDKLLAIKKLVDTSSTAHIVLVVPPDATFLLEDQDAFSKLSQSARAAKRDISVESEDELVIRLAEEAGLVAKRLSHAVTPRVIYDVMPPQSANSERPVSEATGGHSAREMTTFFESWALKKPKFAYGELQLSGHGVIRRIVFVTLCLLIIVGLTSVAALSLPKAEIAVKVRDLDLRSEYTVSVRSQAKITGDGSAIQMSGILLVTTSSLPSSTAQTLLAQGASEAKATGKVRVKNIGVTTSFPLVERSRLISPSGKVYFIQQRLALPAFRGGDQNSASQLVEVEAERYGESYNVVSSNEVWHFIGLKGTSYYEKIVAVPEQEISGGHAVLRTSGAVLSNAVKEAAYAAIEAKIRSIPQGMKFLKDAVFFEVVPINSALISRTIVFDEKKLQEEVLKKLAEGSGKDLSKYQLSDMSLTYSVSGFDHRAGEIMMNVQSHASYKTVISKQDVFELARGKGEAELRASLQAMPDIVSASVTLWPRFMKTIPESDSKVNVSFE